MDWVVGLVGVGHPSRSHLAWKKNSAGDLKTLLGEPLDKRCEKLDERRRKREGDGPEISVVACFAWCTLFVNKKGVAGW